MRETARLSRMAGTLDGAVAKLTRAEEHFRCLQEEIHRWREQNRDPMTRDHNAKRTEFRFYTNWPVAPDPVRWGLVLGDGLHNVRSALDHMVYACSGDEPPARCEFPIFKDRDRFLWPESNEQGGLFKIRGITNERVRAIIQAAQPWSAPEATQQKHLLWLLHTLDNQDKHRLIVPIATVPRNLRAHVQVELFRPGTKDVIDVTGPRRVELQDHALVFAVRTPKPAKRVNVNARLTLGIGVRVNGIDIGTQALLGQLCNDTRSMFIEIGDALGEPVDPPRVHDLPPEALGDEHPP